LRLSPEAIFITAMDPPKADALQKRLGIPVVVLAYGKSGVGTFDETLSESLRLAGKILGQEKRVEAVVGFIEQCRRDLLARVERVADDRKPRIYVGGISLRGTQGSESTDADYPPLAWVNARNLAREAVRGGNLFINRESLLAWNPNFLFLDAGGLTLIAQDCRRKPEFYRHLKAVGEKRTYLLYPFNNYSTNIETVIADASAAGKVLYPAMFSDIDLAQKCDGIYTFFLEKPVYGEMKKNFGDLGRVVDLNEAAQTP
jgi:iron complex transport system substrate-binding protein